VEISASISCRLSCIWRGLDPRVRCDGRLSGGDGSGLFVVTGTVVGAVDGVWSDILSDILRYTVVQEGQEGSGTEDGSKLHAMCS
jgi:hypothetical protein